MYALILLTATMSAVPVHADGGYDIGTKIDTVEVYDTYRTMKECAAHQPAQQLILTAQQVKLQKTSDKHDHPLSWTVCVKIQHSGR